MGQCQAWHILLKIGGHASLLLLPLLLELLPCLLIGYWIGGSSPDLSGRVAAPLVRYGIPLSVMGLLLKGGLSSKMLLAAVIAALTIGITVLLSWSIPMARRRLCGPCGQLGVCVGNTAYFGVPVALALLPPEALSISIGYDLGATLLAWTLGPLLISGGSSVGTGRWFVRVWSGLCSSPALPGLIGALLVQATPWVDPITQMLWWPSKVVLLLALAVVGMRIGSLTRSKRSTIDRFGSLLPALVSKLVLFPLLLLTLCLLLQLDPLMVQAITLQGSAPTAISILLIAEAVNRDQEIAAGLVFWSTSLAILISPLWGYLVKDLVAIQL